MIECVNENIWYIKKSKRRKKKKFLFFVIFFATIFLIYHFFANVCVFIENECNEKLSEISITSINKAVLTKLNGLDTEKLIKIEKDKDGNITHYSINSIETNNLSQSIISETKNLIETNIKNGIPISAGSFLGIKLLVGYGRNIKLKIVSIEKITCDFSSEFLEAGINQTLHRLILTVSVNANVLTPNKNKNFFETSKLLLSESIIVGKIPEIYLNNQ